MHASVRDERLARTEETLIRVAVAVLASLIPWVAWLVTLAVVDRQHLEPSELLLLAIPYLAFVALPSFVPLAVARHRATRIAVLVLLTATAVSAAVAMVSSHDAQAGLAVLWIPYVALPAALAIGVGQAAVAAFTAFAATRRRRHARSGRRLTGG
jgi:hypothetical protein